MVITSITAQQKDKDRVNIFVDGKYRFSLDIFQLTDIGVKVGKEYTEAELIELETESQYGKLYMRTLEYCLMRPHSSKEVRDYLYRKTRDMPSKTGGIRKGVSVDVTHRVFDTLVEKGYIDDEKFSRYWIENRHVKRGVSRRKLIAELRSKGVDMSVIEPLMAESDRDDSDEIQKIIAKKRNRYADDMKLMQYLAGQGFSYDDIKQAIANYSDEG